MVKLTLTFVKREEKTSANSGKKYISLSLKAKEYNEQFLSGFGNKANENWKEGDVVEVAEVKEVSKNGKIYYNFEMPKSFGSNQEIMKALEDIKNTLTKIKLDQAQGMKEIYEAITTGKKTTYPEMVKEPNFDHTADEDLGLESLEETM